MPRTRKRWPVRLGFTRCPSESRVSPSYNFLGEFMAIGKLIFKLPDENSEFKLAQNAWKYKNALEEISNSFRHKDKYTDSVPESWEQIREIIYDILQACDCPPLHEEDT